MSLIVIQYPPDFDGELHIRYERKFIDGCAKYHYEFMHFAEGNHWKTLVKAAKAIIEQDERIKAGKVS